MTDTAQWGPEELAVAFPATPTFTRIGRVTVVGLALRLGLDVSTVEKLRAAVDASVSALQGPGRIQAQASWTTTELTITLDNPDATIDQPKALMARLEELVTNASVERSLIRLNLPTTTT